MPRRIVKKAAAFGLVLKSHRLRSFRKGFSWPLFLLSLLAAGAAFVSFPQALDFALLLLPGLVPAFYLAFSRLAAFRRRSRDGRDFLRLLEELAASVSAGCHPERALREAAAKLEDDLGRDSSLLTALRELRAKLMSGLDPRRSLHEFQLQFGHPHSLEFSRVFPLLAGAGGKLDLYLQLRRDALAREQQAEDEAAAERGGASAEALIMSLMPFLLSLLGQQLSFFSLEGRAASPAQALFCFLSVLALVLCLRLLSPGEKLPTLPSLLFFRPSSPAGRLKLSPLFCCYPSDSSARVRSALRRLYPRSADLEDRYLAAKLRLLILSLSSLSLAGALFRNLLPLFFLPLALVFHELQLFQAVREERRRETLFWPPFLQLIVLLLESGLSCERALRLALSCRLDARTAPRLKKGKILSPSQRELLNLRRRLDSGCSAAAALREAGRGRSNAEIAQFFHRLSRYEQAGGREELEGLRSQSLRLLDLHRLARRREAGRQALLLLLPMAFDLFLVMGISLLPALVRGGLL